MNISNESTIKSIDRLKNTVFSGTTKNIDWRIKQINKIDRLINENKNEIIKALFIDLGKSEIESLSEILLIKEEIKLIKRKLKSWMQPKNIKTPFVPEYSTQPTWYMYSISVEQKLRNKLIEYLKSKSIDTRLSFPPISIQPYYKNKYKFNEVGLSNSIYNYNTFLDIPVSILMSEDDQKKVVKEIVNFVKTNEEK